MTEAERKESESVTSLCDVCTSLWNFSRQKQHVHVLCCLIFSLRSSGVPCSSGSRADMVMVAPSSVLCTRKACEYQQVVFLLTLVSCDLQKLSPVLETHMCTDRVMSHNYTTHRSSDSSRVFFNSTLISLCRRGHFYTSVLHKCAFNGSHEEKITCKCYSWRSPALCRWPGCEEVRGLTVFIFRNLCTRLQLFCIYLQYDGNVFFFFLS